MNVDRRRTRNMNDDGFAIADRERRHVDEGPHYGRYRIAHTEAVITKDTPIRIDRWGNAEIVCDTES